MACKVVEGSGLNRRHRIAGIVGVLLAGGCTDELPPFGEAVVVVDTNAPAQMVEQLRIDVYSRDGRWIESRTVAMLDERDWPTSFSVVAAREDASTEVLVRIRAYPTGRLRDYRGERYEERPVFEPIPVARSVTQACNDARELELGRTRWIRGGRGGRAAFIEGLHNGGNCHQWPTEVGAGVLRVHIPEAGVYRFGALGTQPPRDVQVSIQIRRDCAQDASALACEAGLEWTAWPPGPRDYPAAKEGMILEYLPKLDVAIDEPGSYFVWAVTGGTDRGGWLAPWSVEIGASRVDEWNALEPALDDPPWQVAPDGASEPAEMLMVESGETPASEPLPAVTIDRLVRLDLRYGRQATTQVLLDGRCVGTMAKLREDVSAGGPVLDEAETCVDTENVRTAVAPSAMEDGVSTQGASIVNTFPDAEPCRGARMSDEVVCVPGGFFLFGAAVGGLGLEEILAAVPEKPAIMSPFWIDRREVTVARWRQALAEGFEPPEADGAPFPNDGPYAGTDDPAKLASRDRPMLCTYSTMPIESLDNAAAGPWQQASDPPAAGKPRPARYEIWGSREDWPVNCLSWFAARAFCQFHGGDLPTEAQWEYVATAAGRDRETVFPWGNELPSCSLEECGDGDCHVVRAQRSSVAGACLAQGFGIGAVSELEHDQGDVSVPVNDDPMSVVYGLAGNVGEFMRDGFHPYTSPCWLSTGLRDPSCVEEDAPVRARRGNHYGGGFLGSTGAHRGWIRGADRPRRHSHYPKSTMAVGFRCVYPHSAEAPR